MITLQHSTGRLAVVNTFTLTPWRGPVFRLEAIVRCTDVAGTYRCVAHVQIAERDDIRRKDPEGRPSLIMRRIDERTFRLESCKLHRELPCDTYELVGYCPEAAS